MKDGYAWLLLVILLVACQEKSVKFEGIPFESSLSTVNRLSVENRCVAAYDQLGLEGGCYPSRETVDEVAQQVVSALEEDGWKREGLLRKDFGTWRAVLVRSDEKLAVSVRSLTSQSEGLNQRLFKEGHQSLVTLTLNRDVTQAEAATRTPPGLDTSIARMTDVSPDTRCAEAYQEMNLLGGCYPATSDPDVTARVVVSVLEEDGWKRRGMLRKDFGIWSATLVREGEGLAFSADVLTSQSKGLIRIPFISPTIRNFTGLPAPRPEPVLLLLASARIERTLQPFQSESVSVRNFSGRATSLL